MDGSIEVVAIRAYSRGTLGRLESGGFLVSDCNKFEKENSFEPILL